MKKVFITGGAGGLGLEIAREHAKLGDLVYVIDVVSKQGIEELVFSNSNVNFILCDISRTENVKSSIAVLAQSIDTFDYIYSCAGVYNQAEKYAPLSDVNLDAAAMMYDINAVGFLRVCQVLLPTITDGTVIICVTSEAGSIGMNYRDKEYSYCMSKAAENMACSILQNHYKEHNIDVIVKCIHPGWVRTDMGGEEARANPQYSVSAEESAFAIVQIAREINDIPKDKMYLDYKRNYLEW